MMYTINKKNMSSERHNNYKCWKPNPSPLRLQVSPIPNQGFSALLGGDEEPLTIIGLGGKIPIIFTLDSGIFGYNIDGIYDNATGIVTIPADEIYIVLVNMAYSAASESESFQLLNGSFPVRSSQYLAFSKGPSVFAIINSTLSLHANDNLVIIFAGPPGATVTPSTMASYFSLHRIT